MISIETKDYEQTGMIDICEGQTKLVTVYSLVDAVNIANLMLSNKEVLGMDHKSKIITQLVNDFFMGFPEEECPITRESLHVLFARAYEEGRLSDETYKMTEEHKISGAV